MTASKSQDNKYNYSTIAVVLFTECIKLILSIGIYSKDKELRKLLPEIISNYKVLLLYFVPAFLYCLYNNLAFVNLASYDPTTYYLLLQLRVVFTAIIYQILFKRKLSKFQWISLILLTFGCIVKQMGGFTTNTSSSSFIKFNLLLILLQVFCSCFAGVYNEYLLKDVGSKVHIMIQNVFMYMDSIVCNLFVLLITGEFSRLTELADAAVIFANPTIIAVMMNNALCGIVTSFFLKSLNSILKSFASALELIFTAILCFLIFGIPIDAYTVIAIAIVSYATYLYSQNPVLNQNKDVRNKESNEMNYSLLNDNHNDSTININEDYSKLENSVKRIEHV